MAIETSDLTLVSGELHAAADASRLSRATLRASAGPSATTSLGSASQGRSPMARPGLGPGTPRFSVLRRNLSNWAEIPAKKWVASRDSSERERALCELYAPQLDTEISFGTQ